MRYGAKWPTYAKEWDSMAIKPGRVGEFNAIAAKLFAHKSRYQSIADKTGVPWWMIAVIHMRESDADFSKSLAQGDPWNRRSHNKPISGPFGSFEESALWALKHDGLTGVADWRIEKVLYYLELYNGAGYDMRGLPSPYIWGGTNIQRPGKYTSDGRWSSSAVDIQPGCATMIWALARVDPSISFKRED